MDEPLPDAANALGEFLRVRRARVRPRDVGLPPGPRRRVPGLRREELALLAGVSGSYYVRLEQGRDRHPSDQVLDALSAVLGLGEDGRRHLRALAARRGSVRPATTARRMPVQEVREQVRWLVHRQVTPAVVLSGRLDVLAGNELAAALHVSLRRGRNIVRDVFLDDRARGEYLPGELDRIAANGVAALRTAAGADVDDPRLVALVEELSARSACFRELWSRHDIERKTAGHKTFRHPLVGDITLNLEPLALTGAQRQSLVVYHADPGSAAERGLALLARTATGPGLTVAR